MHEKHRSLIIMTTEHNLIRSDDLHTAFMTFCMEAESMRVDIHVFIPHNCRAYI